MSSDQRKPATIRPFIQVMAVGTIVAACQGAWLTSLAVYLAESAPRIPAAALASGIIAASYAVSVVAAGQPSVRGLRIGLLAMALGAGLVPWALPAGIVALVLGMGMTRANHVSLTAATRGGLSGSRAFAIDNTLRNGAWVLGALGADALRFAFGWRSVHLALAFLFLASSACTKGLDLRPCLDPEKKNKTLDLTVVALLGAVMVFYLCGAEAQTVLALLAEKETRSGAITAGKLGGIHGAMVLGLSLATSLMSGNEGSLRIAAISLALFGAAFLLLAGVPYPTRESWLLLSVLLISAGETWATAHLTALGSRLAGLAARGYWLAATIGYLLSAAFGLAWLRFSHLLFFGILAGVCFAAAGLVLSRESKT